MAEKTQKERLAVVETEIQSVKETVNKIDGKLDTFIASAVTHAQLTEKLNEQNEKIKDLELEIELSKKKNTLFVWLTGTFSVGAGAALTAMITELIRR